MLRSWANALSEKTMASLQALISRARPLAGSLRSPTRNSRLRRLCHIFYNNENESLLAGYGFSSRSVNS